MSKKKGSGSSGHSFGRALIKDRFGRSNKTLNRDSFLHTADLADGYDWGRLNLQSVTEQSSFEEFLSTAELAGTEFTAEKLNVEFVPESRMVGTLTKEERSKIELTHKEFKHFIKIPRRPKWDGKTTPEELETKEKQNFLDWRRNLAEFQEEKELILTPYEKNLDFWRQLWRVVERSDVLVQIVDARNPLLFYCDDLEKYAKEVDKMKTNLLLLNKSDLLTVAQRKYWAKYFDSRGVSVAFYSAKQSEETIEEGNEEAEEQSEKKVEDEVEENEIEDEEEEVTEEDWNSSDFETDEEEEVIGDVVECPKFKNSFDLLSKEELITFFKTIHGNRKRLCDSFVTVGLVGYPNVGKSSTINTLLANKKVSVSSTPGKTKHFQTLFVDKDLMLCDCPGLVMPSFVFTKADLIVNGILSIDQMRDHRPPMNMICSQIPRHILEDQYSIMITKPLEGDDPDRPPTADEFLNAYACSRGYMTANGQPDGARAARVILKHYVSGRLLFCVAPPDIDQLKFHSFPLPDENRAVKTFTPFENILLKPNVTSGSDLDRMFFQKTTMGPHSKGMKKVDIMGKDNNQSQSIQSKPWKNHKEKRNKHEKLRRQFRHLDI
ncbi:large subunit GTPase 1 homolog isoform X2 [Adelges cooleyi]|uniref:large subunit GTPase 1 homolog isoform X2 n=1 Tax=Adelges cooleyi TaxID=133065 RepID=UPI0021801A7D|nr:large subunit GTPase 1 homolog isoform X2 [Adelges cooleyi]